MYTPIKLNKLGVNRWFAFSKKLNREVTFYGELEYDHWVLIEMDPEVTNYCEKPFEINHSYFDKPDTGHGNCWDNAPQESFFGHLKDEVFLKTCTTLDEVKREIKSYMTYYNHYRYQWNLKRMTPVQYRDHLLQAI